MPPVRTPVANAFAERWIGTLRCELLDRTLIWNRQQLERIVVDYIDVYNEHRPHRSLDQRSPSPCVPIPIRSPGSDPVVQQLNAAILRVDRGQVAKTHDGRRFRARLPDLARVGLGPLPLGAEASDFAERRGASVARGLHGSLRSKTRSSRSAR